jgi:hypothetical protein
MPTPIKQTLINTLVSALVAAASSYGTVTVIATQSPDTMRPNPFTSIDGARLQGQIDAVRAQCTDAQQREARYVTRQEFMLEEIKKLRDLHTR